MKVNVTNQDSQVVQLEIEVESEVASQEYNKAVRRFNEKVSIQGFRRGKAPRHVVENNVGAENIKREALESMTPSMLADIVSEHQFDLAADPIIESFKYDLGQPLTVSVKLELKPEVKLGEYKGLVVEVAEFQQGENPVEDELKRISEKFATLEPVVGRPTKETDIVNIDFNGTVDDEPIKGGTSKNYKLDLANSTFIKGFAEQLVDKNIGEDFTIDVTFPEEYHDAALSGKLAKFQVKINEIKEKHIPEINDELAQKVGPFKTIDELKVDVTSFLDKLKENENKTKAEKAITNRVIEEAQVDIPDSMVNREAKHLLEEVQTNIKSQGLSWEQVLDAQGHETIWNNLREEAAKRVKSSLVLSAIAKQENLQLSDDDFQTKVSELATMYNTDEKAVYKQMAGNPGFIQGLSHQIFSQKIVKFLLDNNDVKYIEGTSKEEVK